MLCAVISEIAIQNRLKSLEVFANLITISSPNIQLDLQVVVTEHDGPCRSVAVVNFHTAVLRR